MNIEGHAAATELEHLEQFLNMCPVGLVQFVDDGSIVRINPEALNLLTSVLSVLEFGNIYAALSGAWPSLPSILKHPDVKPGRLVEDQRVPGLHLRSPRWLSMTLVRASNNKNLLAITDVSVTVATETTLRSSEGRLHALFDSIDEGFCICEIIVDDWGIATDYRFLKANPLFEHMTGLIDAEGKTALELVPDLEPTWVEKYARVGLGGETLRFEQGSEAMGRWFDVFSMPLEEPRQFAIVFKDQTEQRTAERTLQKNAAANAFRAQLTDSLRTLNAPNDVQGRASTLLAEYLRAARVHYVEIGESGEYGTVNDDFHRDDLNSLVGSYRLDDHGIEIMKEFRTGKTVAVNDVLDDIRLRDNQGVVTAELGTRSYVFAPLLKDGRPVAGLAVHHTQPHRWSLDEIEIIEETAQRTMAVVDQARSDAAVRTRLSRTTMVAGILVALETSETLELQAQHLAEALVDDFADYASIEIPGGKASILGLAHLDADGLQTLHTLQHHHRVDADVADSIARAADGETQLLWSVTSATYSEYALTPEVSRLLERLSLRSHMSVPLDLGGGVKGALMVGRTQPHRSSYDADDLAFFQDAAERFGVVLAGTRLRREEHNISVRLQQALLPDHIMRHANVEIEARYEAAGTVMTVGGDWFDTFSWKSGHIGVMVGDVVGHSLESAAVMGRLRAGTATLAANIGASPAAVINALDICARGPGGSDFVTAACVVIDPISGEMTFSSAGHPPVLVIGPESATQYLDGAQAPPLCLVDIGPRPEATLLLESGSLVIMYSDGLIERRGEPLDVGMQRLRDIAITLQRRSIVGVADTIVAHMARHSPPEDDVVVVCFRYQPIRADLDASAFATRIDWPNLSAQPQSPD